METSGNLGRQPDGAATDLDNWSRSGGKPMVLAVALGKKIAGNHQNMPHIIPDRERAKPSHLSRPLRSNPAGFESSRMPPAGRFPKEKKRRRKPDYLFVKK